MFLVGGRYLSPFLVPEAGVTVHLHRRSDGVLLDTSVTVADGKFAFTGLATDALVYIMAVKNGNEALVFDNVRPSSEFTLTDDNVLTTNLCDPIGLIGPAVVIGDFTGHTVNWVQLSGPPVTILSDTTLSPTFANVPIGSARTFRLTIDAGTCFEITQDYEVTADPTAIANWPTQSLIRKYSPPSRSITSRGAKATSEVRRLRIEPKVFTFGTTGPIPPDCTPIAAWQILWDQPSAFDSHITEASQVAGRFLRYEVEEYVAGWNVVKSVNKTDTLFADVISGRPYRVVTVWVLGQGTSIQTAGEFRVVSPALVVPDTRNNQLFAGTVSWQKIWNSMFGAVKNFSLQIPTRIVKTPESIANWPTQDLSEKILASSTSSLIEKGLDGTLKSPAFWPTQTYSLRAFQITRNSGSSIGS